MRLRTKPKRPRLESLIPGSGPIAAVLRRVEIASKMIREAYPEGDEPEALFRACVPPPLFRYKTDRLYRAHVTELIARSREARPDYTFGTEAEVLAAILDASQAAPLRRAGMVLADQLWARLFGWSFEDPPTLEEWPGQLHELLTEARRKVKTVR